MRCPNPHLSTPLVVVARRVVDRELMDGVVGCPVCHLEARVVDGVVTFPGGLQIASEAGPGSGAAGTEPGDSAAELARTGALLGLAEPGGVVLLAGRYGALATRLAQEFEVATIVIRADSKVPFSDQTFRAAAIDAAAAFQAAADGDVAADAERTPPLLADAVRAVAVRGRILAPVTVRLPADVKELARDEREWVGEREPAATVVTLSRAGGPPHTGSR
ncbi:MAG: hypothetical protein ACYC0B_10225 [Gemmatimonadaceae bacterium]